MRSFLLYAAGLTVILTTFVFAGGHYHWFQPVPSYSVEIILFLAITTTSLVYLLMRHVGSPSFTQSYLLSVVVKMLGYCIFVVVIIFSDGSGAFANALLFMISYALFTALEVAFLFKRVNS